MTYWNPDIGRYAGPRYLALADALTDAVKAGDLPPGTRLPTHRDLAHRLGVSVHTISQAYAEARRRGYIAGETGRGTFVQTLPSAAPDRHILDRRHAEVIDLSVIRPIRDAGLHARLQSVFTELARDESMAHMLSCRPIAGLDAHRAAGATWLTRLGVDVDADRVVITNGVAHGMTVALSALVEPGAVVATESVTDHGVIALANLLHVRLAGLDTDDEGIRPDALEAACRRQPVKAVVVTPNLTNPTALAMGAERRRDLAQVAARHDVTIVEDDAYGALLTDRPAPLWTHAPDRTVYLTSLTKPVMAGLRTGYLTAPPPLIQRIVARVRATSWMATPLPAEIAARWIADGALEAVIADQRGALRARNALAGRLLADAAIRHHATGLHAWLPLPSPWRAENFVSQLRVRHVAVTSAEPFVVGRAAEPHAVRLCLGGPDTDDELAAALRRVRDVLAVGPEPAYLDV